MRFALAQFLQSTAAAALVLGCAAAGAQDFPSRPIRLVTVESGSSQDVTARLMSPGMSERLGQSVIVENRGVVAINAVAQAPRDGYTVLLYGPTLWLGPFLEDKPTYDPVRDFAPITLAVTAPNILVVHPALPVKSTAELIAYARTRPGQLNYGSGSSGSNAHLAMELFKSMAKIFVVRIPYKGVGLALNDLVAGRLEVIISSASSIVPHIKTGKVRALGITSLQPSSAYPDLPTIASILPGYESSAMTGMFAPAGTPAAVISRLNQDTVRALGATDVKTKLFNIGVEVVGSSPADLDRAMKKEMAVMGKLIKDQGIRE